MKKVISVFLALAFCFLLVQPAAFSVSAAPRVAVTSVKLNVVSIKWAVGKSGRFTVTVLPVNATNKEVIWKSGNSKVMTVDSTGKITAVGIGSTMITCTSKDNALKKAVCAVTVGNPVTAIKLSAAGVRLAVKQTVTLTAAITPSNAIVKSVSWKSNDVTIATVDSTGKVTAVAAGATSITCTANDGSGVKASCGVTVGNSSLGGVLSYMFDPIGNFFYTEDDPWQRQFGFNPLYDWGAPLIALWYSTVRVKFSYNNLDWMVQMWKGQYGFAFIGSEIGVYNKPKNRPAEHYDSVDDENALKMGMALYKKDVKLFTRAYDTYWWATGFVPGSLTRYADRTELTMTARITLKDAEMTAAFVQALAGCGFRQVGFTGFSTPDAFTVRGNDVFFTWKNIEQ